MMLSGCGGCGGGLAALGCMASADGIAALAPAFSGEFIAGDLPDMSMAMLLSDRLRRCALDFSRRRHRRAQLRGRLARLLDLQLIREHRLPQGRGGQQSRHLQ